MKKKVKEEPYYEITSVCKDDIREVFKEEPDKLRLVEKLTHTQMRYIARKMAEDYLDQLYWDSLKIITENVI